MGHFWLSINHTADRGMDERLEIRKGFLESRVSTSYPDSVLSLFIHHPLSSEIINNANL